LLGPALLNRLQTSHGFEESDRLRFAIDHGDLLLYVPARQTAAVEPVSGSIASRPGHRNRIIHKKRGRSYIPRRTGLVFAARTVGQASALATCTLGHIFSPVHRACPAKRVIGPPLRAGTSMRGESDAGLPAFSM
jgi:hypothetical protein